MRCHQSRAGAGGCDTPRRDRGSLQHDLHDTHSDLREPLRAVSGDSPAAAEGTASKSTWKQTECQWEGSTEFSGSEKHKTPCQTHAGGHPAEEHVRWGVVPGDTRGPPGDAPVNPTCNEHSHNQPWKRKVASDTNQQESTHPSAGLKAQDLRVDLHPPQTSAGVFRSHDTAAMTWHLHPLLQ